MSLATEWLTKDQLDAQLRDSTALLESARGEINGLAARMEKVLREYREMTAKVEAIIAIIDAEAVLEDEDSSGDCPACHSSANRTQDRIREILNPSK